MLGGVTGGVPGGVIPPGKILRATGKLTEGQRTRWPASVDLDAYDRRKLVEAVEAVVERVGRPWDVHPATLGR
jgi:hypothetical protein